jgi:hypothetical protein
MPGFASTDATGTTDATDASVSTQSGQLQSGQHPRFDLTKNKLITNIRYFEKATLAGAKWLRDNEIKDLEATKPRSGGERQVIF